MSTSVSASPRYSLRSTCLRLVTRSHVTIHGSSVFYRCHLIECRSRRPIHITRTNSLVDRFGNERYANVYATLSRIESLKTSHVHHSGGSARKVCPNAPYVSRHRWSCLKFTLRFLLRARRVRTREEIFGRADRAHRGRGSHEFLAANDATKYSRCTVLRRLAGARVSRKTNTTVALAAYTGRPRR